MEFGVETYWSFGVHCLEFGVDLQVVVVPPLFKFLQISQKRYQQYESKSHQQPIPSPTQTSQEASEV